jgi:23S rRNA (cytosine1962-C5)-methyltransferase
VALPQVFLAAGRDRRVAAGHPWVYSNEIGMTEAVRALPPGTLATLHRVDGKPLGIGSFHPNTLIAMRLFSRDAGAAVEPGSLPAFVAGFISHRLRAALALRERCFEAPFYRLVHAEADGLPGLVVDRFGDVLVAQINTAGMERLTEEVLEALDRELRPRAIVLRNDAPARALEGLEREVRVAKGTIDGPVPVLQDGLRFEADVRNGQKTGWYYDQAPNRAAVAPLGRGGEVLDVYCHSGAFAVAALAAGASGALGVDTSQPALTLAEGAARAAGVDGRCRFVRAEAFAELERLGSAGKRFRLVVADPPAFAKSRKEVASGLRGYRKLARLAARVVEPGGLLFVASCSHNVEASAFVAEVARGVGQAQRSGRIVRQAGAGPDHPVHLHLPESAYLKTALLHLD